MNYSSGKQAPARNGGQGVRWGNFELVEPVLSLFGLVMARQMHRGTKRRGASRVRGACFFVGVLACQEEVGAFPPCLVTTRIPGNPASHLSHSAEVWVCAIKTERERTWCTHMVAPGVCTGGGGGADRGSTSLRTGSFSLCTGSTSLLPTHSCVLELKFSTLN